jgi:hypothetical protein
MHYLGLQPMKQILSGIDIILENELFEKIHEEQM